MGLISEVAGKCKKEEVTLQMCFWHRIKAFALELEVEITSLEGCDIQRYIQDF